MSGPFCRDCADNDGTCPHDGKPCAVTLPQAEIDRRAAVRRRQAAALAVLRARMEESGLEMRGDPYNLYTSDGDALCSIGVRIPAALIDETIAVLKGAAESC